MTVSNPMTEERYNQIRGLAWPSMRAWYELLDEIERLRAEIQGPHDRVDGLLAANTAEVERRREAEDGDRYSRRVQAEAERDARTLAARLASMDTERAETVLLLQGLSGLPPEVHLADHVRRIEKYLSVDIRAMAQEAKEAEKGT